MNISGTGNHNSSHISQRTVNGFPDRLNPITDPGPSPGPEDPGDQIADSYGITDRVSIGGPDNPCYPPGTQPGFLKFGKKAVDPWTPGGLLNKGPVSAGSGKKATDPWTFTQLFGPGTVRQ